jgi:hypothetical protein
MIEIDSWSLNLEFKAGDGNLGWKLELFQSCSVELIGGIDIRTDENS